MELKKSESIDNKLVESFKNNELGLRCFSFKWSSVEGIINGIRMNYQRENQLWFEVLKCARAEEEVECEGEKEHLKKFCKKWKLIKEWFLQD